MERGRKSPVTGSLSTGSRWNFTTFSFLSFRFFSGVLLSLGCLFVSLLLLSFWFPSVSWRSSWFSLCAVRGDFVAHLLELKKWWSFFSCAAGGAGPRRPSVTCSNPTAPCAHTFCCYDRVVFLFIGIQGVFKVACQGKAAAKGRRFNMDDLRPLW